MKAYGWIALLIGALLVTGCSYTQTEWLGRKLSGIDCRPEHLDARGHCVPAQ